LNHKVVPLEFEESILRDTFDRYVTVLSVPKVFFFEILKRANHSRAPRGGDPPNGPSTGKEDTKDVLSEVSVGYNLTVTVRTTWLAPSVAKDRAPPHPLNPLH